MTFLYYNNYITIIINKYKSLIHQYLYFIFFFNIFNVIFFLIFSLFINIFIIFKISFNDKIIILWEAQVNDKFYKETGYDS